MCRLFGLSGGSRRVAATFWLLDASDSLAAQSHREPDGTGLGTFAADGRPEVEKEPLPAWKDRKFLREARELRSSTFIGHVRFASTGGLEVRNTHPFEQKGRLFAHNGVVGDLQRLDARLGRHLELVGGDTDSERLFALITTEIERRDGDVGVAIVAAASWVAENLPLYALNLILTTPSDLWALRYPDTHELNVLERGPGGERATGLDQSSSLGLRVHSQELADAPSVLVASEAMDDDSAWRPMTAGELLHVDGELTVTSTQALSGPPAHPLTLADLGGPAARSQAGGGA